MRKHHIRYLKTGALLSLTPMLLFANNGFPRWYNALLSLHMPPWLIKILENPWLVAGTAMLLFMAKVIVFSYLSAKLLKERRKNRQLNEQNKALSIANEELRKDSEHHKAVVTHLTETLINLSTLSKSPTKPHNKQHPENNTPRIPPTMPL